MQDKKSRFDQLTFVRRLEDETNAASLLAWYPCQADAENDFEEASRRGAAYAIEFVQFLRDSMQSGANMLGVIVEHMDHQDKETAGYRVGFFAVMELLLCELSADHIDSFIESIRSAGLL